MSRSEDVRGTHLLISPRFRDFFLIKPDLPVLNDL